MLILLSKPAVPGIPYAVTDDELGGKLATIHQPIEEISRYAVNCLVRRSKGETIPVNTLFPVRLVARETT